MEQVALGSSLNDLSFGAQTVQNGSAELAVILLVCMLVKLNTELWHYEPLKMS